MFCRLFATITHGKLRRFGHFKMLSGKEAAGKGKTFIKIQKKNHANNN
jgi:hypothetical protein